MESATLNHPPPEDLMN
jgi:hypothetical protein